MESQISRKLHFLGVKVPAVSATETLLDALRRLKAWPGRIPDRELWIQGTEKKPMEIVKPWAERTRSELDGLAVIADVLEDLRTSVLRVQKDLRTELAWHYGLAKLPDEILLEMITLARADPDDDEDMDSSVDGDSDSDSGTGSDTNTDTDKRSCTEIIESRYSDLLQLSAVCRRFRNIITSNARFWTTLCNRQSPVFHDVALRRSRDAKLSLVVDSDPDTCLEFLDKMHRQFPRVSSLELVFIGADYWRIGTWRSVRDVLGSFAKMDLPSLERLTVKAPRQKFEVVDHFDASDSPLKVDDDMFHIYITWNAPSLKHLKLVDLLPRVHSGLSLTSLDLWFDMDWPSKNLLLRLVPFLQSQPSLETIILNIGSSLTEHGVAQQKIEIRLPLLRTLSITAACNPQGRASREFDVPLLVKSLYMPAVKYIDIKMPVRENNDEFSMDSMFTACPEYTNVEQLHFDLWNRFPSLRISPFKTIFTKFPNLKLLEIKFPLSRLDVELPSVSAHPPPPLEKIILESCTFVDADALRRILEYLSGGQSWDKFTELCLHRCHQMTSASAELIINFETLPKDKICLWPIDTPRGNRRHRCDRCKRRLVR